MRRGHVRWNGLKILATLLPFVMLLDGCGDGREPPTANDGEPPSANAGRDQDVVLGSLVALDGSDSRDPDGGEITFRWSFVTKPSGSTAALSDPTSPTPTFTADVAGAYSMSLVVSDGESLSEPDRIVINASCDGERIFDNGEWIVARQDASIPEEPFAVIVSGNMCGMTKLLTFARRVTDTNRFPQVMAVNSSGFLRIKAGADPTPPIPFGQSVVLGPAIFGTSTSFTNTTLFFNPQVQSVLVDISQLDAQGTGSLLIQLVANDLDLPAATTKTNQIMNLSWDVVLQEPTEARTQIDVTSRFTLTEDVTPDPVRTAEFQSLRLVQVSSMFIDDRRHDVDGMRYRDAAGLAQLFYAPDLAETLLPQLPTALDPDVLLLDVVHTDDDGEPNGNTPSYRVTVLRSEGPVMGPITPRAFFATTEDVNDDNLGVWLYQEPSQPEIPAGTTGTFEYRVVATTDPLALP